MHFNNCEIDLLIATCKSTISCFIGMLVNWNFFILVHMKICFCTHKSTKLLWNFVSDYKKMNSTAKRGFKFFTLEINLTNVFAIIILCYWISIRCRGKNSNKSVDNGSLSSYISFPALNLFSHFTFQESPPTVLFRPSLVLVRIKNVEKWPAGLTSL